MSNRKVRNAHIRAVLPTLHGALMEIVGAINAPERDGDMLAMAGLSLERALFPLLVLVDRLGPIGVVDLASRVGRDYTTVSRQTARLEQLGLIERRGSPTDRRVREASITVQGKAATVRVDLAREKMALALFRDWEEDDFDALVRLLVKLARRMEQDVTDELVMMEETQRPQASMRASATRLRI